MHKNSENSDECKTNLWAVFMPGLFLDTTKGNIKVVK